MRTSQKKVSGVPPSSRYQRDFGAARRCQCLVSGHWPLVSGVNNNALGLRIASLEAILSFEVGGALRFRFEAKAETSEFFTSNLQPQT